MMFKKGVFVEAEQYFKVGLKNAQPMVEHTSIEGGKYIIPLKNLRMLNESEASEVRGAYKQSQEGSKISNDYLQPDITQNPYVKEQQTTDPGVPQDAEVVDESEIQTTPAETGLLASIKAKAKDYALGAGLGAVGGFLLGRVTKAGWPATIGLTFIAAIAGGYVYSRIKNKKKIIP